MAGKSKRILKAQECSLPLLRQYENNGFEAVATLAPDYSYLVNGERKHKFGYRLERFRKDTSLIYEEGLSERELALLNGIPRIWDSGKVRYVKKL